MKIAPRLSTQTPRAHWSGVFAMSLCVFALVASELMPLGLLTPIAADLGVAEGTAGQGIAISGAFAVLTSLSISVLVGTTNRKVLLLWLTGLMAVSGAVVAMAHGYVTSMACAPWRGHRQRFMARSSHEEREDRGLEDELSKHVRAVERGASLIVTDRDRPVARLVPIEDEDAIDVLGDDEVAKRRAFVEQLLASFTKIALRDSPREAQAFRARLPDLRFATHDASLSVAARAVGFNLMH